MVDNIKVFTEIEIENIDLKKFTPYIGKNQGQSESVSDEIDYESTYYSTDLNRMKLSYFPNSNTLRLSGKLLGFQSLPRTPNIDDVVESRAEMIDQIRKLSGEVNKYLINAHTDIFDWHLTRCDFCINVYTPFCGRYLEFFNLFYKYRKTINFKGYKNFTIERNCKLDSSFYLKPAAQYDKNKNQNFTLNIYNKTDQLESIRKKHLAKFGRSSIKEDEFLASENALRMEVQAHHDYLKKICRENGIRFKTLTLRDLLDIDISRNAVAEKLVQFFTECDFYSYDAALKKIRESEIKLTPKFKEYLSAISRKKKVDSVFYSKKLKDMGIFPYMFIPKNWGIDKLENPIKMIDRKIHKMEINDLKWRLIK